MKIRTLTVLLTIGLACTSAAALLASGTSAPAAVPGNEGKEKPASVQATEALLLRNGLAEACRKAVWPYIPASCIHNASPEQLARPVRIIRFETAPDRS